MTNSERNLAYSLYQGIKVALNSLADRVYEICNVLIASTYKLPWPVAQNGLEGVVRLVGDLSRLFQEFPRQTVYKFSGTKWTIIFVGEDENIVEMRRLFFTDEDVVPQEIDRVALWHLPTQCERWWAEGVDLVIGASSRISPYWPHALLRFTMPVWIEQVLNLPEDLESLLSGRRMKHVRNVLNRGQKADFSWYYSQSKDDFDHFYYNMYVPYIKERHDSRAFIAPYEAIWQDFAKGGLIVVTQNNNRVGGGVIYIRNKTCIATMGGVLNSDPELLENGIVASTDWFTMNWAYQQGARIYDIGGTRPWLSNGVFYYKARWGAKATRLKEIYKVWTFLAQDVSPELQQHINKIGFISEVKGKFYATLLDTEILPLSTSEIYQQLSVAEKDGLDGLLVVSAEERRVIPVVASTIE